MKFVTTIAIVLATGLTCFAADPTDGIIKFQNNSDDNRLATSKLLAHFRANGIKAEKAGEEALIVTVNSADDADIVVILEPKLSIDRIDRIVIQKGFRIKWAYKHGDAVKELIWNANRVSNASQYYIDDDGDLAVRMFVTFINELDQEELLGGIKYITELAVYGLSLADKQWLDYMQ